MKNQASLKRKEWKYLKTIAYFLAFASLYFLGITIKDFVYPYLLPQVKVGNYSLKELYKKAKEEEVVGKTQKEKEEAKRFVKEVEKKYPFPSLVNLLKEDYGKRKPYFVLGGALFLLLANLPFLLFFLYDKKVMRPFFFWTPTKEHPLEKGKALRLLDYDYLNLNREKVYSWFFKSKEMEEEFWAVLNKRIPEGVKFVFVDGEEREKVWEEKKEGEVIYDAIEINTFLKEKVDALVDFALKHGGLTEERKEEFRITFTFALYHRILENFGGIPTGFLSPRIKSKVAKRVLSTYYLHKLPFLSPKDEDYEARKWLKAFYDYCLIKEDLLNQCLKFSQIPDIEFFIV